jgi:hypothetical protein
MDLDMNSTETRPETLPEPVAADEVEMRRPRLQLSVTQVIASGLAAVTATLTASYLGLSGTVVGAALASAITVCGSAIYAHSIARTRQRVLPGTRADARSMAPTPGPKEPIGPGLRRLGFAAVGLFMTILGVIAGAQLVSGRPISQVLRDGPTTTVTVTTHPTQTVNEVVVPTTLTVTTTATSSASTTPTATSTPTPTPTPTPTSTGSAVPGVAPPTAP